MPKEHITLSVNPVVNNWFKEHGICKSRFFEEAWETYIKNDQVFRARQLAEKLLQIDQEKEKFTSEFEQLTGTKQYQTYLDTFGIDLQNEEKLKLRKLVEAMSKQHRKMIGDPDKEHFVINWIEGRAPDFGLNLPAVVILEKIKENGMND